ncbi:MAG: 3-deoxy-8-phosphooctulonate synthase [Thermoleophilaceae bacterium]
MIRTEITPDLAVGDGAPPLVIAGPCVLESHELSLEIGAECRRVCEALGASYVFKASFDKANRTSVGSYRGPAFEHGLELLAAARRELGVPVLTDVHDPHQVDAVAEVVDVLQIPAFLSRQTDLLLAAAASGRTVNVKKGQFLAPWDMEHVVAKLEEGGTRRILLTERGTSFGYNTLVVDFRSLPAMRALGYPVVFDATHSVQAPGGAGGASGGNREDVPYLARAAAAVGVDALFLEVHPDPDRAPSDGPNMVRLEGLPELLAGVARAGGWPASPAATAQPAPQA